MHNRLFLNNVTLIPPPQKYIERALKLQQRYCCRYRHNENGASVVNNCECEAESEYTM